MLSCLAGVRSSAGSALPWLEVQCFFLVVCACMFCAGQKAPGTIVVKDPLMQEVLLSHKNLRAVSCLSLAFKKLVRSSHTE